MREEDLSVTGIVLKRFPLRENDFLVTLLTKEKGKIPVFAYGARRQNSRLLGVLEPFCFGTFRLLPVKGGYRADSAQIRNYFECFRKDMDAAFYGTFFLELADYYTRENNEETALLHLLYVALRALEKGTIERKLVCCIYEIRALVTQGEFPGVIQKVRSDTAYTIDFIVHSPLNHLYTFTVSDAVLVELCAFCKELRKRCIDRPLKSLAMLEMGSI
ncbi:MAG: DNA repair protein RecO [Lachnospiraceae bacterium]|nr:DNA repair protein RecO [Lachnospiraceae bacterium]